MLKTKIFKTILPIKDFLLCTTPDIWIQIALTEQETLLIDHAHCEKKAASSAMNIIFHYPQHYDLMQQMSRIVREEMRHFEQVLALMKKREILFKNLTPSRYVKELRKYARTDWQGHLIDLLIIGAFVEARSCERFASLAEYLDPELRSFYLSLLKSESRHYEVYLNFAKQYALEPIEGRVAFFAEIEKNLILAPDSQFRFHSGTGLA